MSSTFRTSLRQIDIRTFSLRETLVGHRTKPLRGSALRVQQLGVTGTPCTRDLPMLTGEAIRLVLQQEPNHDPLPANASPLRQRMIDDMRMRQLAPKTQDIYLHIVREFARFLGRSPDTATVEDLRRYQLYLVDHGTSPCRSTRDHRPEVLLHVTLDRPELMVRMQPVRVPRVLPVVLSPDEVRRLIEAAANLKHQTALSVAYGAGLRASEVVALKVTDVDSERMTLRIEQGKGRRDRYAMLSPVLLERLRVWWRVARAQGKMLQRVAIPGLDPLDQLSTRQLNRAIHAAAEAANIDKRVSMHTLRHYLPFRTMSSASAAPRMAPIRDGT